MCFVRKKIAVLLCVISSFNLAVEPFELSKQLKHAACAGEVKLLKDLIVQECPSVDVVQELFFWAAGCGQVGSMQALLDRGVEINKKDFEGSTALDRAAGLGHLDAVSYLLEHGASVDGDSEEDDSCSRKTALIWAAGNGHVAVVEQLLKHGASVNRQDTIGNSALHWAAGEGVRNKKDISEPLSCACEGTDRLVAAGLKAEQAVVFQGGFLQPQKGERTILERQTDYTRTVRALLAAGADLLLASSTGMLPLHSAIVSGNVASAREIINAAPTIDARIGMVNSSENSEYKRSPLLLALRRCEGAREKLYKLNSRETTESLMRLLIVNGADTTKGDAQGLSPLYWIQKRLKWSEGERLLDIFSELSRRYFSVYALSKKSEQSAAKEHEAMFKDLMQRESSYTKDAQALRDNCDRWLALLQAELSVEGEPSYLSAPSWDKIGKLIEVEQSTKYVVPQLRCGSASVENQPAAESARYVPPHLRGRTVQAQEDDSGWSLVKGKSKGKKKR